MAANDRIVVTRSGGEHTGTSQSGGLEKEGFGFPVAIHGDVTYASGLTFSVGRALKE